MFNIVFMPFRRALPFSQRPGLHRISVPERTSLTEQARKPVTGFIKFATADTDRESTPPSAESSLAN